MGGWMDGREYTQQANEEFEFYVFLWPASFEEVRVPCVVGRGGGEVKVS